MGYQFKNITNAEVNNLLLEDLIIWTNYEIEVAAYNSAGLGVYSMKVTEWTLQGGRQGQQGQWDGQGRPQSRGCRWGGGMGGRRVDGEVSGGWDVLGRDEVGLADGGEGTSWSCRCELSLHPGSAHGASRECAG